MLASLLLPGLLRASAPLPIAREPLADRFWADSETVEPRLHLRQCLVSLRTTFGRQCVTATRHDLQIETGWCRTDLEEIFEAYRHALGATSQEERLHWLMCAEYYIRGEFFEGWTPDSHEATIWLIHCRAEIRTRLLPILLLLVETLEQTDNLNGAFDIVRRILQIWPEHRESRTKAWALARATGQQDVMIWLDRRHDLQEAILKLPEGGLNAVALKDRRLFQQLFDAELEALPPRLNRAVLRLAVLPAAFPTEIAQSICKVGPKTLTALARTPFLESRTGDGQANSNTCYLLFALPPVVRECALRRLAFTDRRSLQRRLAQFCIKALVTPNPPLSAPPPSLAAIEQGRPFFQATLKWVLEQRPTSSLVHFINLLRYCGLNDLALQGVGYLEVIVNLGTCPATLRIHAGLSAAYIWMQADDPASAIAPLESALPIACDLADSVWLADLHATLMMAYNTLGKWEAAEAHCTEGMRHYRQSKNRAGEIHCLRILAEICLHSGKPDEGLLLIREVLALRRHELTAAHYSSPTGKRDDIADALYWQARILLALKRWTEALDAIEEALAIWRESGDTKLGICLCVLGQIRGQQGRFAEAHSHLAHALLLHTRTGREAHRVPALEALADLHTAQAQFATALPLYEKCLTYYTSRKHTAAISRLQKRITEQRS